MHMRRITNLLGVWVLLALIHHGMHGRFHFEALFDNAEYEMAEVKAALEGRESNVRRVDDPHDTAMEMILDFPLFTIIKIVGVDDGKRGFEQPLMDRVLNSLLAGLLWLLVGYILVTSLASEDSNLRNFFTGNIDETTRIPDVVKHAPVASLVGSLKRAESKRFGPALIIAFFHLMFTGASNSFNAAAIMGGNAGGSDFAHLMRLPLTPLFVSSDFWRTGGDQAKAVVSMGNSLLVGVAIMVVIEVLRLYRSKEK